ncbi:NAD-dependent epimerase/dehydratase family protein [Pseudomonas japonica]|uniref:NAD-dependent epimerase/dehydratase family protein n=1 Tax=Pseudomonas japonica TaxID=256466 RepID=UPI0015E33C9A|nr:NAD-dependent epimerase/dehydratase family protein [Pseudomonas japonica]MBA1241968.1 NAD-dependent epimerase/dehydratase family protein [Pseudomonas japonica]
MKDRNEICLVTGGGGFIGCAIAKSLTERFAQVVVMDNLHPQVHSQRVRPKDLHSDVKFVLGDVTSSNSWDAVLSVYQPDVIYHLAAETGTGQSLTESYRHSNVNVSGTACMLDALSKHSITPRKIILTSSRAVYGEGGWRDAEGGLTYPGMRTKAMLDNNQWDFPGLLPTPFSAVITLPKPTSIYGITKFAQEEILRCWCDAYGVELIITRLQNVYGVGQSLTNPYTGIVPFFTQLAKSGRSIPVYEDGKIVRDFVYITDVANALIEVLDRNLGNHIVDIGSGVPNTINRLANLIAKRYGAPDPHICGLYREGDVRSASCDLNPTLELISWRPQVSFEAGIDALCTWIDQLAKGIK